MAYKDLRTYIDELENANELHRIKTQVDWDGEIGAIMRAVYKRRGPAVMFENVKDSKIPRLLCAMHEAKKYGIDVGLRASTVRNRLPQERRVPVSRRRLCSAAPVQRKRAGQGE